MLEDHEDCCRSMLQAMLKAINEGAERTEQSKVTFEQFIENVDLPVFQRRWKDSTMDNETQQIRYHLVPAFGGETLRRITREMLQNFLDQSAKRVGRSVVDHLRFRLRSVFKLALAERASTGIRLGLCSVRRKQSRRRRRE